MFSFFSDTLQSGFPRKVSFTWSTGPQNFEFCELIDSIWKLCGSEVPGRHNTQVFRFSIASMTPRRALSGNPALNGPGVRVLWVVNRALKMPLKWQFGWIGAGRQSWKKRVFTLGWKLGQPLSSAAVHFLFCQLCCTNKCQSLTPLAKQNLYWRWVKG